MTYKFTQLAPKIQRQLEKDWLVKHHGNYIEYVWNSHFRPELEKLRSQLQFIPPQLRGSNLKSCLKPLLSDDCFKYNNLIEQSAKVSIETFVNSKYCPEITVGSLFQKCADNARSDFQGLKEYSRTAGFAKQFLTTLNLDYYEDGVEVLDDN